MRAFGNPRLSELSFVDIDFCQLGDYGFQGPIRVWGGSHQGVAALSL